MGRRQSTSALSASPGFVVVLAVTWVVGASADAVDGREVVVGASVVAVVTRAVAGTVWVVTAPVVVVAAAVVVVRPEEAVVVVDEGATVVVVVDGRSVRGAVVTVATGVTRPEPVAVGLRRAGVVATDRGTTVATFTFGLLAGAAPSVGAGVAGSGGTELGAIPTAPGAVAPLPPRAAAPSIVVGEAGENSGAGRLPSISDESSPLISQMTLPSSTMARATSVPGEGRNEKMRSVTPEAGSDGVQW